MDGISISNAMKGVIAAQTEKDDSTSAKTYAATDLIQLYANDGTPNGKINRTDFMNAVQASLGSILNGGTAQTTGITKVPSLVGNTLGATTVENLASAVGGKQVITLNDNSPIKLSNNESGYGILLLSENNLFDIKYIGTVSYSVGLNNLINESRITFGETSTGTFKLYYDSSYHLWLTNNSGREITISYLLLD